MPSLSTRTLAPVSPRITGRPTLPLKSATLTPGVFATVRPMVWVPARRISSRCKTDTGRDKLDSLRPSGSAVTMTCW